MAEQIRMPKMSDTMTEGVISSWHKKVGDKVKAGDILADVETDKATMELESYQDGTLLFIGVKEKEAVAVDGLIAIIGQEGESYESLLGNTSALQNTPAFSNESAAPETEVQIASVSVPDDVFVIRMPKMSDTMTEGTIANWLKQVGDMVKPGDILAEVETDKATMELEAYEKGKLLYIGVEKGKSVKVDEIIAIIGGDGVDVSALISGAATTSKVAQAPQKEKLAPSANQTNGKANSNTQRLKISPLAKQIAKQKGLDLATFTGSGENGRIIKRDLDRISMASKPETAATRKSELVPTISESESFSEVAVSQMRKTIARRLSESLFTAPHFYLTMEIEMDNAIVARKSINEFLESKVSFNDLVIKAAAMALRKNPKVNSSWLGDKIRYNNHINIGMAVAVEDGLLVPVIRNADLKGLKQISAEAKDFGSRAKSKQLQPADWEGSTFTISNLGMFGIEEFTAIINPPDACILAVGGIKETVIVKNGQMKAGNVMKVTLSCDHRVVDGALGAAFLQTFKGLLEDPVRMLG